MGLYTVTGGEILGSLTILSNVPRGISFIICAKKEIGMVFIFDGLSYLLCVVAKQYRTRPFFISIFDLTINLLAVQVR